MNEALPVDASVLREEVKAKYRAVAVDPHGSYHFHTGRPLSRRLGYDEAVVASLPESAVEAFAGVGNPFSMGNSGSSIGIVGRARKQWSWGSRAAQKPRCGWSQMMWRRSSSRPACS